MWSNGSVLDWKGKRGLLGALSKDSLDGEWGMGGGGGEEEGWEERGGGGGWRNSSS